MIDIYEWIIWKEWDVSSQLQCLTREAVDAPFLEVFQVEWGSEQPDLVEGVRAQNEMIFDVPFNQCFF